MSINIEFQHGLYDFQGHHSGAKIGRNKEMEQEISELVDGADVALYRTDGYFFDSISDEVFVFGHLVEWDSVRPGECFFDLYATSLGEIKDISVTNLTKSLLDQSQHISEKEQSIERSVIVTVQRQNIAAAAGSGPGREDIDERTPDEPTTDEGQSGCTNRSEERLDSAESAESPAESASTDRDQNRSHPSADKGQSAPSQERDDNQLSDADLNFIAQFWEHYRRGTDPVRASVEQVDKMASLVDGTLSNVRFVSRVHDDGDPYHFDVVDHGNARKYDVSGLVNRIKSISENKSLSWEDLPTYEEELNNLVASRREALGSSFATLAEKDSFVTSLEAFSSRFTPNRTDGVDQSRLEFYHDTWSMFVEDYWATLSNFETVVQQRAAETLVKAVNPNTDLVDESEDDGGLIGKMGGLVSGGEDRNYEYEANQIDVKHVDNEEIQRVMRRVGEQALEDAYKEIDDNVGDNLRERLEQRAHSVSMEVVSHIDAIRDSRAYRETYPNSYTK